MAQIKNLEEWHKYDKKLRINLIFVGIIVLLLVLLIFYFFTRNPALFEDLVLSFGLLGLFIGSIIANASIILPLPIDIFVFLFGGENFFELGFLNPLFLGLLIGFGSTIGEMSGYILGLLGIHSIEHLKKGELKKVMQVKEAIKHYGMLVIALGALTPFPFDVIGIASGLIRYNVKKFFIACFAGKALRYTVIAYAGSLSIGAVRTIYGF